MTPPDPPLADDVIRLTFTRVPDGAVLRNLFFKGGEPADVGVWSQLRDDPSSA